MDINFSGPIWLTLKLASVTVMILLAIGTPMAWWLAHTRSKLRVGFEAVVALPLVLPPTVLGFYLLILLGPNGWIGGPVKELTGSPLSFTFTGLVLPQPFTHYHLLCSLCKATLNRLEAPPLKPQRH